MKAFSAALALLFAAMPLVVSSADSDKVLQNIKGSVTYQPASGSKQPLAPRASIPLSDNTVASTGGASEASISLPDSSQVLIGQNSTVTLGSFNQTDIANAKFVVVGKVRFKVQHVGGARANYTFQTSTGQIAVRGTEGDISSNANGLQVNVYELGNPDLPVQVTLNNGRVFVLHAGQSLVATAAGAAVAASVGALSQSTFAPFAEFGAPANASALGITAATTATTTAATTAAASGIATTTAAVAATTAVAAGVVSSSTGSSTPQPSPTPSPVPTPATTPVPIVIQGNPVGGAPAVPTAPIVTHPGIPGAPVGAPHLPTGAGPGHPPGSQPPQ